jgi:hypothetical protein
MTFDGSGGISVHNALSLADADAPISPKQTRSAKLALFKIATLGSENITHLQYRQSLVGRAKNGCTVIDNSVRMKNTRLLIRPSITSGQLQVLLGPAC